MSPLIARALARKTDGEIQTHVIVYDKQPITVPKCISRGVYWYHRSKGRSHEDICAGVHSKRTYAPGAKDRQKRAAMKSDGVA